MIVTLVILLILIVFLAFFIGMNLQNVCTFWIFKTFTDLPVAVLALIAFAAGIMASILIYCVAKLRKAAHEDREDAIRNEVQIKQKRVQKELKKAEKRARRSGKTTEKTPDNQNNIIVQEEPKND